MSTSGKMFYSYGAKRASSKRHKEGFFRRIDRRFPLLKLILVIVVGVVIILDVLDVTVASVNDPEMELTRAPMVRHAKTIERDLTGKKLVALTFDDGPSALTTPKLLDVLKNRAVPVTFFMLGKMASYNPDIVKRAKSEGHEIASHTMSHQNLNALTSLGVQDEVQSARGVLSDILGDVPNLLRPPYGNTNDKVRENAKAPLILWSVDSLDWQSRDAGVVLREVEGAAYDGAIILMHDIYDSTVEAVPLVIDKLRDGGYEFVTVSELAKIRGVELKEGEIYYNFR